MIYALWLSGLATGSDLAQLLYHSDLLLCDGGTGERRNKVVIQYEDFSCFLLSTLVQLA